MRCPPPPRKIPSYRHKEWRVIVHDYLSEGMSLDEAYWDACNVYIEANDYIGEREDFSLVDKIKNRKPKINRKWNSLLSVDQIVI